MTAAGVMLLSTALAQSSAPPLTLHDAASIALEKNPLRKAALADTKAASAGVREAQSLLMPHVTFSEQATRGNDPVYVFGSKLRQQRFTSDDFSLNKLNTPLPYGNFTTRFGGTWNLFDSFASWRGVDRAKEMNVAAGRQLERTEQEILFRVVQSYYGVLLAAKQLEVAEQSEKTAKSIADRSQARYDAGLVVESDLLSAKVRLAGRDQDLIRSRNNLELARAQLNVAMGVSVDALYQIGDALTEQNLTASSLLELEQQALATRPDLKRIEAQQSVQELSVAIAKSSFGPRLSAFAGWEMDNPTFVAGVGGNNWLGGIELQIDLFQGGAKRAALSREHANLPGYPGTTSVLGDLLVDVDQNFNPTWVWNTFDHLDVNRHPMNFPDWTHGNAILYSSEDHNLLFSMRHQNWILKIDYQDGSGSGDIVWRLGPDGDFTLLGGTDPTDWFYAQHGPSFFSGNTAGLFQLGVMDNGDDRQFPSSVVCDQPGQPPCHYSRTPVLDIDENSKTATLISNYTPSPALYSYFGGNVEQLANGDTQADFCAVRSGATIQEVSPAVGAQRIVWQAITPGAAQFRAGHLPSLYPGIQW